ncbi:MAG: collagen-like protein, partial [Oscillospiraceae bacterium]|nr:collagen-like protein [Oscillospiraceae bacterium]
MKKTSLFVILSLFIAAVLLGSFVALNTGAERRAFPRGGFILSGETYSDEAGTFAREYQFLAGTEFRAQYPSNIAFRDASSEKVSVRTEGFVHYEDGAFSTLSTAVLMNLDDLGASFVNYYNVTPDTLIERVGERYELNLISGNVSVGGFVMKLESGKMLIASPALELHLTNSDAVTFENYLEVSYVDENVINILHENGAYLTVAPECYVIASGARIDLAAKRISRIGTDDAMYIEQMVVGADDNIELITDLETFRYNMPQIKLPEIKMPTFVAIDGESGPEGEAGRSGDAGSDGITGKAGETGETGGVGKDGTLGTEGVSGEFGEDGLDGQVGVNGTSGAPGATGDSVGGGTEDEDDEVADSADVSGLPTVKLINDGENSFSASPLGGISGFLRVTDKKDLLADQYSKLTVVERATGRVVYAVGGEDDENFSLTEFLGDSSSGGGVFEIKAEAIAQYNDNAGYALVEGYEYVLNIESAYTFNNQTHTKVFLSKVFTASALGIEMYLHKAETDSLTFHVRKSAESPVVALEVALYLGDGSPVGTELFPHVKVGEGGGKVSFDENNIAAVMFHKGADETTTLSSNTRYMVKIHNVQTSEVSNVEATYGGFVEGTTLKVLPEIKGVNVVVGQGFTLQATGITGEYKDYIQSYRYEIYNADVADDNFRGQSALCTVSTSGTSPVVVSTSDIAGFLRNTAYRARVVGIFHDNEKLVEIEMYDSAGENDRQYLSKSFKITAGNMPIVTFIPDGDLNVTDKPTTIKGTIVITEQASGVNISGDKFDIVFKNASGYTSKTLNDTTFVIITGGDGLKTYKYDVTATSLQKDSEYTITVAGLVNLSGDSNNYEKMTLGTVRAGTGDYTPLAAQMTEMSVSGTSWAFNLGLKEVEKLYGGDEDYWYKLESAPQTAAKNRTQGTIARVEAIEFHVYYGDVTGPLMEAQMVPTKMFADETDRNAYYASDTGQAEIAAANNDPIKPVIVSCGANTDGTLKVYIYDGEQDDGTWTNVWKPHSGNDEVYAELKGKGYLVDSATIRDQKRFDQNNVANTASYETESDFEEAYVKSDGTSGYKVSNDTLNLSAAKFDEQKYTVVAAYAYDFTGHTTNKIPLYNNWVVVTPSQGSPPINEDTYSDYFAVTELTKQNLSTTNTVAPDAYLAEIAKDIVNGSEGTIAATKANLERELLNSTIIGYNITPKLGETFTKVTTEMTYRMYKLDNFNNNTNTVLDVKNTLPDGEVGDFESTLNYNLGTEYTLVAEFRFDGNRAADWFTSQTAPPTLNVLFTGTGDALEGEPDYTSDKYDDGVPIYKWSRSNDVSSGAETIKVNSSSTGYYVYVPAGRGEQYFFTFHAKLNNGKDANGEDKFYYYPTQDADYLKEPTSDKPNFKYLAVLRSTRRDAPKQNVEFRFYPYNVTNGETTYTPWIKYSLSDVDAALTGSGIEIKSDNSGFNTITGTTNKIFAAAVLPLLDGSKNTSSSNAFMTKNGMDMQIKVNYALY